MGSENRVGLGETAWEGEPVLVGACETAWEGAPVLVGECEALGGTLVHVLECELVQELVRDHDVGGGGDVGLVLC